MPETPRPAWNPERYLQFADERTRPCRDLVAAVALAAPARIADLGCGPGNSTAVLAARWPAARIAGVDASPEMIAAARQSPAGDRAAWEVGDLASWTAAPPRDLVFSNAALQWVPDHAALVPRLFAQVAPGGALAVQVPMNVDAPAQRAMRELAASAAWRESFPAPVRSWHVGPPESYYDLLAPRAARVDLWTATYFHVLPGVSAIVDWYQGTGLRPYLAPLDPGLRPRFVADFTAAVAAAYPPQPDGKILFPFERLFFVAYRA